MTTPIYENYGKVSPSFLTITLFVWVMCTAFQRESHSWRPIENRFQHYKWNVKQIQIQMKPVTISYITNQSPISFHSVDSEQWTLATSDMLLILLLSRLWVGVITVISFRVVTIVCIRVITPLLKNTLPFFLAKPPPPLNL